MMRRMKCSLVFAVLLLFGCATVPSGPSVMVLPGYGKSFDQFQVDDVLCRQWASQQIGQSPQDTITQNTVTGSVAGTLIGAGLGAAIGAATGSPGTGAAIGAASGLLLGTSAGANSAQVYGWEAQRRYDISYQQCMYAKGTQIPGVAQRPPRSYAVPPAPSGSGYAPSPSAPYPAPSQ